jgi:hypothetical protein
MLERMWLHRIHDDGEAADVQGAWPWDREARADRDRLAADAARRFLDRTRAADEMCWRCDASRSTTSVGLCADCRTDLREG